MQVKKQQLELDMEQQTGSKLGKEYVKAVYCHPAYLTYIQSTSCKILGWMKLRMESRLQGEISITSDMQMADMHPYGRKWRRTEQPLDESAFTFISSLEEWKSGLKAQHSEKKKKIMFSCPIASWQIDGETVETVADFILGGSKITADGDWSHEIKRHLLPGGEVMTNLDSILKSRDITLPTRVCIVKVTVFLVVTYGCESWTTRRLSTKELMLSDRGAGEDFWGTLGQKGAQTSQS